jgi:hypothetical protein
MCMDGTQLVYMCMDGTQLVYMCMDGTQLVYMCMDGTQLVYMCMDGIQCICVWTVLSVYVYGRYSVSQLHFFFVLFVGVLNPCYSSLDSLALSCGVKLFLFGRRHGPSSAL